MRSDLVGELADEMEVSEREARQLVKHFFNSIGKILEEEGRLELRGFGVFELRQRKGRISQNPLTGEETEVPSRQVPVFKPGKDLKEAVRQSND